MWICLVLEKGEKLILVKMLENNYAGNPFALWECGRCGVHVRLGFKVGRARGECYNCQQKIRERESYRAVYEKKTDGKQRTCLVCDKMFASAGWHNRRCQACQASCDFIESHHSMRGSSSSSEPFHQMILRRMELSDE